MKTVWIQWFRGCVYMESNFVRLPQCLIQSDRCAACQCCYAPAWPADGAIATKYVVLSKYALMIVVYVFHSSINSIARWLWCIVHYTPHSLGCFPPWLALLMTMRFSHHWLHAEELPVISSELCNYINKPRQLSQPLCVMRKTTYQQQVHFPFCLLGVLQYIYSWCPRFLVLPLKHKFIKSL